MTEFLETVGHHIGNLGHFGYFVVGLIVYLETVIVVGQFLPGSLFLALIGFLCYLQVFGFEEMVTCVFLAHYSGEITNYYLGRVKGRSLFSDNARILKNSFLVAAERRFSSSGAKLLFVCQFSGVLRPVVSFVAGASHYSLLRFCIVMVFAAFTWALAHLGIGFLLGASWTQAVDYVESLSLLALVVVVTGGFTAWLIRLLVNHAGEFGGWVETMSRRIHASGRYQSIAARCPRLFGFLEARLSLSRSWGFRATLGWLISLSLLACFGIILAEVNGSDRWRHLDVAVVSLLAQLRKPAADSFFLFVTGFGALPLVLGLAIIAAGFALRVRQTASAFTILGSVALATALSHIFKISYSRVRPEIVMALVDAPGFSFPSSHASVSVAFLCPVSLWLWNHPGNPRLKSFLAFLALGLAPLVGFSRVYLGVHFPTDVVAGFFLGLASTVLMATLARNLSSLSDTPRRADLPMALVLGIGLTCAVVLGKHAAPPGLEFSAPQSRVDVRTTESLLAAMPREVRRVTGKATLPTNLMIAGDLEMVLDVLRGQNWKTVAPNAFYTREVHSPVFPAFVDEQPAGVTLQKTARDERFVLRLWKCPTTIRGANAWVGSLIREKVRRRYLGMTIYAVDPDLDLATDAFSVVIREIHPNPVDGFRQRGLYSWKHQFFTHGNALLIDATRGGKSR